MLSRDMVTRALVAALVAAVLVAPSAAADRSASGGSPGDLDVWTSVSAAQGSDDGWASTCGLQVDGSLWCWGANAKGQLGLGDTKPRYRPYQVGSDTDWTFVAAAGGDTCALRSDHTLWCWGSGFTDTPTQVGTAGTWSSISNAGAYWCGTQLDDTLWCWGVNSSGQLGLGDYTDRPSPTQVGTAVDWAVVSASGGHTCAVRTEGTLWCWGTSDDGALGLGNGVYTVDVPMQVGTQTDWASVNEGALFSCGSRTDHTAWCWGNNDLGELGNGSQTYEYVPVQVGSDTDWRSVAGGTYHTCGERLDGSLWCWGGNGFGELGLGTKGNIYENPTQVGKLTTWANYSPGGSETCSVRTNHSLWCWGNPKGGQLGVGDRTHRTDVPVQVGLPNIPVAVSRSLVGVSADAVDDVWAVGSTLRKQVSQTLVEHWDGTAWTRTPSPNPDIHHSRLAAVAALSPTDVWAVGTSGVSTSTHTLIEHWDGTSWSQVSGPNVGPSAELVSIDAISATDIWAVGDIEPPFGYPHPLAEHWDGSTWHVVDNLSLPEWASKQFTAVRAVSDDDVWAVGYGLTDEEGNYHPLVEHYNGKAWKLVQLAHVNPGADHFLRAVTGTADDLSTVGDIGTSDMATTLDEHYDGTRWTHERTPTSPSPPGSHLFAASAVASTDVWAVGSTASGNRVTAFAVHWDGTSWTQVSAPDADGDKTVLSGVSGIASDDAWAAGTAHGPYKTLPVVEHWDGSTWTVVLS